MAARDDQALAATLLGRAPRPPGGRLGRLRARAKLASGRPLLHDEPLDLDAAFVVELAAQLLRLGRERGEPAAAQALAALEGGRLNQPRLIEEVFVGHRAHALQLVGGLGAEREPLLEALELGVQPLLMLAAEATREHVAAGGWQRPYCPVCGTTGALGAEGGLRCPRCGTAWNGSYEPDHPGFHLELADRSGERDWQDD